MLITNHSSTLRQSVSSKIRLSTSHLFLFVFRQMLIVFSSVSLARAAPEEADNRSFFLSFPPSLSLCVAMLGIHNSFKAFLVLCLSSKHCSLRRRRIWRHLQLALPERHRLLRLIIVVVVAAAPLFIRIQSFRCIIISFLSVCVTFLFFLLFVCCANGRSVKYDYTSTSSTRVSWWTIHWQCIRSMCVSVIRSVAAALSLSHP